MILENICIDSLDLLKALAEESYNKKHHRFSYFEKEW